jgi:hypothetical protein
MAKIDKSQFTKSEWHQIREQRRKQKKQVKSVNSSEFNEKPLPKKPTYVNHKTAFVLGNGTSRSRINPADIRKYGPIYGCNALYREYAPDYLVAVDVKMILEISKAGYQNQNTVWTNPNKSFSKISNLNYFQPSKGWSSGPTALYLACQHGYKKIYILGFDYKGLENGKKVNNIYAGTWNYKRSSDGATYYGNWLKQTKKVISEYSNIQFVRVIQSDNFCPEELNNLTNLKHMKYEDFKKIFNLK